MLRNIVESENKEMLEELHGKVLASVEGATGLNEDKGVLVSPLIKENENGTSYFTVAVGEEGKNDLTISTDIHDINVVESVESDDEADSPSQEELENMQ